MTPIAAIVPARQAPGGAAIQITTLAEVAAPTAVTALGSVSEATMTEAAAARGTWNLLIPVDPAIAIEGMTQVNLERLIDPPAAEGLVNPAGRANPSLPLLPRYPKLPSRQPHTLLRCRKRLRLRSRLLHW